MTARVFIDTNALVLSTRQPGTRQADACQGMASARLADCSYLLTEDLQHGQNLDGLRVINPFQASPEDLHQSNSSESTA